jgi:hypothetical protein
VYGPYLARSARVSASPIGSFFGTDFFAGDAFLAGAAFFAGTAFFSGAFFFAVAIKPQFA